MIRVRCRQCGCRFQLRAEDAGKKGKCPNQDCGYAFRVPAANTSTKLPEQNQPRRSAKPSAKTIGVLSNASKKKRKKAGRKTNQSHTNYSIWGISTVVLLCIVGVLATWIQSSSDAVSTENLVQAAEQIHPQDKVDFSADIKPFFVKHCLDCHSNDYQEGDFNFDRYSDVSIIKQDREVWSKVLHLVKVGAMPPSSVEHPTSAEKEKVTNWVDHQLFYVDCSLAHDPGRVTTRRLNRTEYNNTIRDLLNVDFQPADDFPSDDVGYGFDNIGDVLSVPPLLIEKYLSAAEQVAEKAVPTRHPQYFIKRARGNELAESGAATGGNGQKTIASRGAVSHDFKFPDKGTYRIKIDAMADQAGDELAKMEIKLGDKVLKTVEIKDHKKRNEILLDIPASAGTQSVTAGFINDFYDAQAEGRKDRNLFVDFIQVEGPLGLPESVSSTSPLLQVLPGEGISAEHAAQANLREFLPQAFRRPVQEDEVVKYAGLVVMAYEREKSFPMAMRVGLQAVLISPHFLFRVEDGRQQVDSLELLNDYALASRLSYFLWSSLPDPELFELARQNRLHEPAILKEQTLRMLADPKSNALVQNFSGQWLGLRKLTTNEVAPDPKLFPEFDDQLRQNLWKETELFFGSIVQENRSIYDLLDGRYSFLNQRLAELYGIEGVQGEEFRRVEFQEGQRMGVLTQGSVLTLTSYPNRTSPVKRGQWVLENLLNDPPPEAPPVVPALEETQEANPNLSFRQQLELHRQDPGCASCHNLMDGIGFGLENFDAIGRWRTQDGKFDIDSSGSLPSGETFSGPAELISILGKRKTQFGRCLAEKLMTYALGRGIEYYDRCALDDVMSQLDEDDRFSSLVLAIVNSAPFQMRRESAPATAEAN